VLADKFDFSKYNTLCDVGGATGLLAMLVAKRYPHMRCTSFDLPVVEPIAKKARACEGLSDRVKTASGDFFKDALPKADVITMGMILHDWNLKNKKHLIRLAYDALALGGAFIAIENLINDAGRENAFGLMMSLNMLIEFGNAFDLSGADLWDWCKEAGFKTLRSPSSGSLQRCDRIQLVHCLFPKDHIHSRDNVGRLRHHLARQSLELVAGHRVGFPAALFCFGQKLRIAHRFQKAIAENFNPIGGNPGAAHDRPAK
jgi:O-methyltransferase domain